MTREKILIPKSPCSGFTLIETAIGILIASSMLVGAAALAKNWMKQYAEVTNQQRLTSIQQALHNYERQNNRLPCPASYTAAPDTTLYGREASLPSPANCAGVSYPGRTGTTDPLGTGPVSLGMLFIGALPVRDLGLPDSYIGNSYGYRYTYAVTQSEAAPITPGPIPPPNLSSLNPFAGAIDVKDQNGNTVLPLDINGKSGTALYAVADHGADGKGAYNIDGKASRPCTAGTGLDVQNCNLYASGYFRSARFSSAPGPNWFDDSIIYQTGISSAKICTTVFGTSPFFGLSLGWDESGVDAGGGAGDNLMILPPPFFAFFEFFDFGFANAFFVSPTATPNHTSPTADAYCPDTSFHVVTGGCSQTWWAPIQAGNGAVTNVYGADINWLPATFQMIMPPLSHPLLPNSTGMQGWECNGSSSIGMETQAYATCCTNGGN
jgi:type II secretory pathway pseudopilin PulG